MLAGLRARHRRLQPGEQVGRYEVIEPLRCCGPFSAYIARASGAIGFEKRFRLQVLTPGRGDAALVDALIEEARLAARLDHPNVATVVDLGRSDDSYFLATELVEGVDLQTLLETVTAHGEIPLPASLQIVVAVAGALQHAHSRADLDGRRLGVLHLGVSPEAVMLRRDGEIKLSDFAVLRALARSESGEPAALRSLYTAPEVLRGDPVDGRADIFALGVVLHDLLSGRPRSSREVEPIVRLRPGITPELAEIVGRATAIDIAERFATADELRLALLHLAAVGGVQISSVALRECMAAHDLETSGEGAVPLTE